MKILQIVTLSGLGGAQTVVANLSNSLIRLGHDVAVIAGEGDGKLFDILVPEIERIKLNSLVRRLSPLNEIKTLYLLRKLYRRFKPDIIHLHSSKAALLGRIALPRSKIVYTVHGFDSIRLAYRKYLPLERLLQHQCAAIVGVSKYDEISLKEEEINNNVSTVYNGIYPPSLLTGDPFSHINGYNGNVLCIARLSPQKNHKLFIEVARLLPQYAFIWIGNQYTPDFEYPENVYFMGNIPNAGAYIRFADLFMLPSNYEGLPMVIIEALSQGIPVVASDVGGISELLDGKNGYAVSNDSNMMAGKITEILSKSATERNIMSRCAIQTYKSRFTVEQMADGYLQIYSTIFGKNFSPKTKTHSSA